MNTKSNIKKIIKQSNLSINFREKFYEDNVIDKTEFESLCNIFINTLMKIKMNLFNKYEHKDKIKLFSLNKFTFLPKTSKLKNCLCLIITFELFCNLNGCEIKMYCK